LRDQSETSGAVWVDETFPFPYVESYCEEPGTIPRGDEVVLDCPAKYLHECLVGNFRQTRVGVQQMRVGVVFSSSFLSARDNLKLRIRLKWRSAGQMMNYYWEYTRTYVFDKNELG
jgi:hypothetical protein